MKTFSKLALLAATLVPVVYVIGFGVLAFSMFSSFSGGHGPFGGGPFSGGSVARHDPRDIFPFIFMANFFIIIYSFGLIAFYIVHLVRSEAIKSEMKAVWAIIVFMAGPIGMLIYWYMNIWKGPGAGSPDYR